MRCERGSSTSYTVTAGRGRRQRAHARAPRVVTQTLDYLEASFARDPSLAELAALAGVASAHTTLTTQHLKDAVTREMVARGYEFSKEPELLVDFAMAAMNSRGPPLPARSFVFTPGARHEPGRKRHRGLSRHSLPDQGCGKGRRVLHEAPRFHARAPAPSGVRNGVCGWRQSAAQRTRSGRIAAYAGRSFEDPDGNPVELFEPARERQ